MGEPQPEGKRLASSPLTIFFVVAAAWLQQSTMALATVSEADTARVITAIYAGAVGAVVGDVDADGAATAADLLRTLAGLRNPTWPGPYRAGITHALFTKQSATKPDQPRPLETVIWYPTDGEEESDAAIADAPLAEGMFPLLLFSHGSCGIPEQSPFLMTMIAGHGFLVAAPPHPGNTLRDGASCRDVATLLDSFLNRVDDVMFVTDAMVALESDPGSMFFRAIDAERVGVFGHSFGGQTSFRVAVADPRMRAAMPLAPAAPIPLSLAGEIRIPVMIQGAENDASVPFEQNSQAPFALLSPPRYLMKILGAGHLAWAGDCRPPDPRCEPLRLALRYAVPFLLERVAGDARFSAFLDPGAAPPGVEYIVDPP